MIEKNFLFLKTSSLGDIIHTLPSALYLKEKMPTSHLAWVVEEEYASMLDYFPQIDAVIGVPWRSFRKGKASWKDVYESLRFLRQGMYDVSFDFQGNTKSGVLHSLANSKRKVGFLEPAEFLNRLTCTEKFRVDTKQIQYKYLSLLCQGMNWKEPENIPSFMRTPSKDARLLIAPFSHWDSKMVPFSQFEEALSFPYDVICGSKEEHAQLEGFFSGAQNVYVKPTFSEWITITKKAAGVVGVDSAQLHLAALCGTPTFGLFGPSNPSMYSPMGSKHTSIQGECPLEVSFESRCPHLRTCSNKGCIKAMPPFKGRLDEWISEIKEQIVQPAYQS